MHLDYLITQTHMSMPHNPEKKKKSDDAKIFLKYLFQTENMSVILLMSMSFKENEHTYTFL